MTIFDSRRNQSPEDTGGLRDRNELEVLSKDECLAVLASRSIGRVGITHRALPVILPVNYALLNGDVVITTGVGSKLEAAVVRAIVAFEVDDIDEGTRTGWSVCVKGRAEELVRPDDIEAAEALGMQTFCPSERHRYVRISTDLMTGRRVR